MKNRLEPGTIQNRCGITFLVAGFLVATYFGYLDYREIVITFPERFISLAMVVGGAFLCWRGRQYRAQATAQNIFGDAKPDVLYLRAFEADRSIFRYVAWCFFLPRLVSGLITEEEQLRDVLRPFGDLVAIGRPGEKLPTPGAARLYVSDAEWQSVVSDQMRSAALVVIRAGRGKGLLWELKQAFAHLDPTKLLILVLKMKRKDYAAFREEMSTMLGVSFPAFHGFTLFRRVSGFVRFSSDWTPEMLRLYAPYARRTIYKPYQPLFHFTLKPVFKDFGLEWQTPPVSILSVVVKLFYAGFALLLFFAVLIAIDESFSLHWFDDI
jgi:hypothetical protein